MYGTKTNTVLIALVVSLASGVKQAPADEFDLYGEVRLVSDYIFRGVSQTMSRPAVQGMLAADHGSGWYGYAWASNVDFTEPGQVADGASAEINVALGYWHAIGERAKLGFERTRYVFPATHPGFDYDYSEWNACLALDEAHSLRVGYSDSVFASEAVGVFYAANTGLELSDRVEFDVEIGYYDLKRAFDATYGYTEFALSGTANRFDWRVVYVMTSGDAAHLFPTSTVSDRIVVELGLAF